LTQILGIEHKLRTIHCTYAPFSATGDRPLATRSNRWIGARKNRQTARLWPILLGKFLIAFFSSTKRDNAVCLTGRIASTAFVCIRRERFANEWRHCERTRHLDATNYQSLSRNNKAKPWKKIPVKSIAFHMHLARPRGTRGGV